MTTEGTTEETTETIAMPRLKLKGSKPESQKGTESSTKSKRTTGRSSSTS